MFQTQKKIAFSSQWHVLANTPHDQPHSIRPLSANMFQQVCMPGSPPPGQPHAILKFTYGRTLSYPGTLTSLTLRMTLPTFASSTTMAGNQAKCAESTDFTLKIKARRPAPAWSLSVPRIDYRPVRGSTLVTQYDGHSRRPFRRRHRSTPS